MQKPRLKPPRMFDWLLITAVLTALIALTAPQMLQVSLYKLSLAAGAAFLGYRIDRSAFPYARPDELALSDQETAAAYIRRAIIMGACIVGICLGA